MVLIVLPGMTRTAVDRALRAAQADYGILRRVRQGAYSAETGEAVTMNSDHRAYFHISDYSSRDIGAQVQSGDRRAVVSATNLTFEPMAGDFLLEFPPSDPPYDFGELPWAVFQWEGIETDRYPDGMRTMEIVRVQAPQMRGIVLCWNLQLRGAV